VRLLLDPRVRETLVSLAILLGSYLAARLVSFLFAQVLTRAARRTASSLDDRLIAALERPLTYSLFLVGAWAAVHRLPVHPRWVDRSDGVLFLLAAGLVTLAVARAYGIFLSWYTTESRHPRAEGLAKEFGPLFGKVGKVFIAVIGAITILQHFGVDVASLVVSLGVGSLAVGLAAQYTTRQQAVAGAQWDLYLGRGTWRASGTLLAERWPYDFWGAGEGSAAPPEPYTARTVRLEASLLRLVVAEGQGQGLWLGLRAAGREDAIGGLAPAGALAGCAAAVEAAWKPDGSS